MSDTLLVLFLQTMHPFPITSKLEEKVGPFILTLPFFRQRRRKIIDNIWIRRGSQIPSFPQATRCLHVRAHPYPCTNRAACGKEGFWVTRRIHGEVKKTAL